MGAKGKASDYYVFYHITWEKLGLAAANLCAAALEGFVFAELIRQLLYRMTERNLAGMKEILVLTAVSALVYLLFCCLDGYFGFRIRQRMQVACQDELFDRYLDSCNWEESFIRQVLGQLMTTLGTFAEDTAQLYRAVIRQIFLTVFSCLYILSISPAILLIGLFLCLVFLFFYRRPAGRVSDQKKEFMRALEQVYARLKEQVANRDIAAYLNNDRVTEGVKEADQEFLYQIFTAKKTENPVSLFAVGGSLFLVLAGSVLGGMMVLKGRLAAADLVAVLLVIPNLSSGLFAIPGLMTSWKKCAGERRHYEEFLGSGHFAAKDEKSWRPEAERGDRFESLRVEGLTCRTGDGKMILRSLDADFPCGQFLCLAGPSGCGKTTLLNILARYCSCDGDGTAVRLGERTLSGIDRDDYWSRVLYIHNQQEVLEQTLAYNIALSEGKADEGRLREALRLADLEDWFLKAGGDFYGMLRREQLSSGERQKLAMARFFYRNCLGGLFDEITSAMDAESEKRIVKNLKEWVGRDPRRFVIFVSHRRQPLEEADHIYYMENGRIEAEGSHRELLALPAYQRLLRKEG